MDIRNAQDLVNELSHVSGQSNASTESMHVFLHLIEEIGGTAKTLLNQDNLESKRVKDAIADIFWQLLRLSSHLDIDLQEQFVNAYDIKNKRFSRVGKN
jgi:NTP pyrophosphatase (non-canonical NTP hydrolase)